MNDIHQSSERITSSTEALALLKSGNKRYLNENIQFVYNHEKDRANFINGQNPYAIIITCSDSRVVPEIFFDAKLGDLFVIRNAGNVVDKTVIASIEYAVEHLEVPLIAVIGHTHCGAVTAAESKEKMKDSELKSLVNKIRDVIKDFKGDSAVECNVQHSAEKIEKNALVNKEKVKVVGGMYDILSGKVTWI